MSVESYRVAMGTCGWKHEAWHKDFYPEDLPEDWLLGFYANEFSVVYVPAAEWLDDTDITEWLENVSASFRFILELPVSCLKSEECFFTALDKIQLFGEHCLGLVFQLDTSFSKDIKEFQLKLEMALKLAPVCVDKRGTQVSAEFETILITHDVSEVWNGLTDQKESAKADIARGLARGKLAIARVSSDGLGTVDLRKVLETCLAASTDERVTVLCIDGHPPSIEILRNADIILNLL